jgi:hypothetical protein
MRTPIIIGGGGSIHIYSAEKLVSRGESEGWYRYSLASVGLANRVLTIELDEAGRLTLRRDTGPKGPRTLSIWTEGSLSGPPSLIVKGYPGVGAPLEVSVRGTQLGDPRDERYEGYPHIRFVYRWPLDGALDLPRSYRLEGPHGVIHERTVSNAVFEFNDLGSGTTLRIPFPWWAVGVGAGLLLAGILASRRIASERDEGGDWNEPW